MVTSSTPPEGSSRLTTTGEGALADLADLYADRKPAALPPALPSPGGDQPGPSRRLPSDLRRRTQALAQVRPLLTAAGLLESRPGEEVRVIQARVADETVVVTVQPPGRATGLILKVASTAPAAADLAVQQSVLAWLHAQVRLSEWRTLLPRVRWSGAVDGTFGSIESQLPGQSGEAAQGGAAGLPMAFGCAAAAIATLHRRSARTLVVDEATLDRWVDERVRQVARWTDRAAALERIRGELRGALGGTAVAVSWVHGDYRLGNVRCAPGGRVTGIVDWGRSAPDELPLHDQLNLLLSAERQQTGQELGEMLAAHLRAERWTDLAQAIFGLGPTPRPAAAPRVLLRLYWLRSVATALARTPERCQRRQWLDRNLEVVLAGQ
jgi:hypothetical protein